MITIQVCPLQHEVNVAETEYRGIRTYKKEFVMAIFSVDYGQKMIYQGREYIVNTGEFCNDCSNYLDSGLLE